MVNELRLMGDKDVSHFSYEPLNDDIIDFEKGSLSFNLQGIIIGPCATPFEAGILFLSIQVPPGYPFTPSRIKFLTKVFHPNVVSDGTIKIDILSTNWSSALSIQKVLLSICSFLPDPNHHEDSCNPVCDLYWKNRNRYNQIAREWTLKYAMLTPIVHILHCPFY